MDSLTFAFAVCQALGAIVGVGSAIWGELEYHHAMRDGKIDKAEHRFLEILHRGLRFGMSIVLLSSFGLVVVAYGQQASPQPVLTTSYWLLMIVSFIIIGASWAMARRVVAVTRGSIIAFTAWWFLAFLTLGQMSITSLEAGLASFIIAIILFGIVLVAARRFTSLKK